MAACAKFYEEKHAQAAKVFAERYGAALAQREQGVADWAAARQPELHGRLKAAEREIDSLWKAGDFCEAFKGQVLAYLRAWLELCRLYAAEIGEVG